MCIVCRRCYLLLPRWLPVFTALQTTRALLLPLYHSKEEEPQLTVFLLMCNSLHSVMSTYSRLYTRGGCGPGDQMLTNNGIHGNVLCCSCYLCHMACVISWKFQNHVSILQCQWRHRVAVWHVSQRDACALSRNFFLAFLLVSAPARSMCPPRHHSRLEL